MSYVVSGFSRTRWQRRGHAGLLPGTFATHVLLPAIIGVMGRDARLTKAGRRRANAIPKCPDFELAPLRAYPPEVLAADSDGAEGLVLSLALAFNDMKGIQWWTYQLGKCEPKPGVDPEAGQWLGMRLQTTRLTLLILHEALKAIKTAQGTGVLDAQLFQQALSGLDRRQLASWQELLELANDKPNDSPIRQYIERVRHNFSAHYYQPDALVKGYRSFFIDREPGPFNECAYASFGDKIENTRFYFADAAVQSGQRLLDPKDELLGQVRSYVLQMFQALRFLIETYLDLKTHAVRGAHG